MGHMQISEAQRSQERLSLGHGWNLQTAAAGRPADGNRWEQA